MIPSRVGHRIVFQGQFGFAQGRRVAAQVDEPHHPLVEAAGQALNLPSLGVDEAVNLDQIGPGGGPVGIVPGLIEGGGKTGLAEGAFDHRETDVLFRLDGQERTVAAGFLLADDADHQGVQFRARAVVAGDER